MSSSRCNDALRCAAISVALMLGLAASSAAQNVGTVIGGVKDPEGLSIPGATVLLTNRVSQTKQEAVSDDAGRFTFGNVPYGTYVLSAVLSGFAPIEQLVDVRSSVPVAKDIELRVGTVSEA